ncbi:uncharacterized protein LOC135714466 [Ochlerotatus camptorhynchus]|uniref:uncharacterized protein LOC135714466 n=1 Tax=Ochlerotatus camptorhynchus TaxID=644619 RepID=UPI0031E1823E
MFFKKTFSAERKVLQVGLKMLNLIGVWDNEARDNRRIYRYFALVGWMLLNIMIPKAVLGSGKDGFDSVARNLAEFIFFSDVCIASGIFVTRRRSYGQLVQVLKETLDRYESKDYIQEIRQFNRRMDSFARGYNAYVGFLLALFLGIPIVWTLCKCIFVPDYKRTDYILIFEVQYYYLDIRRNIVHYLIYFTFAGPAIMCSAYQSCLKAAVFLTPLQYGAKLFDLIQMRINNLGDAKAGEERRDELRMIIELHKMALKYTELLEETLSFILLNQILNCMAIWCLMMFYLSTVSIANDARCALAVSHAIYKYPWHLEPAAMQRDLRFMMQRAQKPTGITAAKFYFVNIQRLGIVMQASYSYYLILKNRF